jgi:hypothetical protein
MPTKTDATVRIMFLRRGFDLLVIAKTMAVIKSPSINPNLTNLCRLAQLYAKKKYDPCNSKAKA